MSNIAKVKRILKNDGIGELVRRTGLYLDYLLRTHFQTGIRPTLNRLYRYTDKHKVTSPTQVYSERYHQKRQTGVLARDAKEMSKVIQSELALESVIDLGCSIGHYLKPLAESGVTVYGVDGDRDALKHGVVPSDQLAQVDLREPFEPPQEFDVALCIEVAEHLAPEYADTLVATCTRCAPVVIFTAAPPGQGGTHRVNEQPHRYWIELFETQGYEHDTATRDRIQEQVDVDKIDHVRDNLLVFRER